MINTNSPKASAWNASTGGHSPYSIFFNMIHPLPEKAIEIIDKGTFPITIEKGRFLIKPGNTTDHYYLILKGVIRAYIKEDGKEITTWINDENEIVGSIRGLALNVPCEEYLQAIETTNLIGIPYKLVEQLYETFPEANIIGRKILEQSYRDAEERAFICRIPSAEKRYKRFVETRPRLINRVSLKYIASYLGMTNETLSRVRSRM
ncbi:MAG: Crp/Fnr family transcriptional regulator [Bacteroidota bacterium]